MPKKYARKTARKFPMVRFETDIFEGTFELPALSSLDLKTQRSLMKNDTEPLFEILAEAKVDKDAIEAIDSLTGDEVQGFMSSWQKADKVPAPKSGA